MHACTRKVINVLSAEPRVQDQPYYGRSAGWPENAAVRLIRDSIDLEERRGQAIACNEPRKRQVRERGLEI